MVTKGQNSVFIYGKELVRLNSDCVWARFVGVTSKHNGSNFHKTYTM